MAETVKRLAKLTTEFNVAERNLLSVAYKEVMGSRRAAWRIILKYQEKQEENPDEMQGRVLQDYRERIEQEMTEVCGDLLGFIDKSLLPASTNEEAKAFYLKLKGDYYRYLCEFLAGPAKKEAAESALICYRDASDLVITHLDPAHPLRLGIALNFSVFYYDVLHSLDRASQIARQAFDDAMTALNGLNEDHFKESALLMQLIRDNLTLWLGAQQPEIQA